MRRLRSFALCLCLVLIVVGSLPTAAAPRIVYRRTGGGERPRVALTFDDGPHPRYTPQILDILAEYAIKATFFVVGENASYYPDVVRRTVAEGHEIGNHTYHHYRAARLSGEAFAAEVNACSNTLQKLIGTRPVLFRPPEGVCTESAKSFCAQEDLTIVMWSVDTRDWAHTPPDAICRNVRQNTKDGAIILMHDYIGKNSPTPTALRQLIPMLREAGYSFVTVSQLLADEP